MKGTKHASKKKKKYVLQYTNLKYSSMSFWSFFSSSIHSITLRLKYVKLIAYTNYNLCRVISKQLK